jgi:kynurenine formamidase
MTKLIDLSMPVHGDMIVFPRVARPIISMLENWEEFAERIGAAQYGTTWLTASCVIVQGDHVGTHIDSLRHLRKDAPGPEGIPIEFCFGDGVLLDFRDKPAGYGITVEDVQEALRKINYTIKPLDIPLIWTGAGAYNDSERYLSEHSGMTGEATNWLLDQGVKVTGIDAITYDRPVKTMFEKKEFWPAHKVMIDREYYHLENMMNFEQLPRPTGFKLSVFPVKWVMSTASPVRAVAIFED